MGRMKETPRYNVISLRISDGEWDLLREMRKQTKQSVSKIMREALFQFIGEEGDGGTGLAESWHRPENTKEEHR